MPSPDWDAMFEALAAEYRRRLLVALLDHNPQEDVPVPEEIQVGEEDLKVLQREMYHTHLPRLEDTGFIEWDKESHEVVKGPKFDEIRPVLERIDTHRDELPEDWL